MIVEIVCHWFICGLLGFCLLIGIAVSTAAKGESRITDVSPIRYAVALVVCLILGPIGVLMDACRLLTSWLNRMVKRAEQPGEQ